DAEQVRNRRAEPEVNARSQQHRVVRSGRDADHESEQREAEKDIDSHGPKDSATRRLRASPARPRRADLHFPRSPCNGRDACRYRLLLRRSVATDNWGSYGRSRGELLLRAIKGALRGGAGAPLDVPLPCLPAPDRQHLWRPGALAARTRAD